MLEKMEAIINKQKEVPPPPPIPLLRDSNC